MRNKSILFALAICVDMQFGVSFGMEKETPVVAQPAQSWSNWLSSSAGRAWSAAKSVPGRATKAIKNAPSEWWTSRKKKQM